MKKLIRKAYLLSAIAATFVATVVPAIIQAADVPPPALPALPAPQAMAMRITAYSSTVDQTDSTPFITANGVHVHDGVVATNALPFGTQIKIPALFGDKVFTVEDRMARRIKMA